MASLQEAPVWEEKIYRIQAHIDSPVGGSDGLTNLQPRQIANRTRWLLDRMGREHSLNGHLIFADEIADDAAIDGDKTLLDKTFEELHALLSECGTKLEFLREKAGEVIGRDGLKFEAVTRAQRFLWEKGAYSFGWEFFTDGLNMRQFITERPILSTVHHDDTIILEDVTGISEGDLMVVYSEGGADAEIIEVEHIICDSSTGQYRILAKDVRDPETGEILEYAINVDRNSGFIGSMSWTLDENGNGYAVPGAIYLSGTVYCLSNAHGGKLIVRFLDKSGPLRIEVNYGNGWEEIECAYNESAGIVNKNLNDNEAYNIFTPDLLVDDITPYANIIGNIPLATQTTAGKLPKSLSFLDMYKVGKIEQLNIMNRWIKNDPTLSISAPIGVREDGKTFELDLHDLVIQIKNKL